MRAATEKAQSIISLYIRSACARRGSLRMLFFLRFIIVIFRTYIHIYTHRIRVMGNYFNLVVNSRTRARM